MLHSDWGVHRPSQHLQNDTSRLAECYVDRKRRSARCSADIKCRTEVDDRSLMTIGRGPDVGLSLTARRNNVVVDRCKVSHTAYVKYKICGYRLERQGKGSPYSITELRVPELIPVLGSQPAGDVSHKPGGRLPLLSARPAVTPATLKRAATNFAAW